MASLERTLRKDLEKTVKQARRVAEAGARKAVEQIGVGEAEAPKHLTTEQRALRNRLRADGRQLGDRRDPRGVQATVRLVQVKAGHPSLAAIAAARVGDAAYIVREGSSWVLQNEHLQTIGRMAKSWSPPEGRSFLKGNIGAIVRWRRSDNQEEYRPHLHHDAWETSRRFP